MSLAWPVILRPTLLRSDLAFAEARQPASCVSGMCPCSPNNGRSPATGVRRSRVVARRSSATALASPAQLQTRAVLRGPPRRDCRPSHEAPAIAPRHSRCAGAGISQAGEGGGRGAGVHRRRAFADGRLGHCVSDRRSSACEVAGDREGGGTAGASRRDRRERRARVAEDGRATQRSVVGSEEQGTCRQHAEAAASHWSAGVAGTDPPCYVSLLRQCSGLCLSMARLALIFSRGFLMCSRPYSRASIRRLFSPCAR